MKIKILNEYGHKESLIGIGLNKKIITDDIENINGRDLKRLQNIADKLSQLDGGHNKFLESIQVWLDISAPLYWWKQFDTYRIGISKQSESTMHTLMKFPLKQTDFQQPLPESLFLMLVKLREQNNFEQLNNCLPHSYRQRRIVNINYKALRNIYFQRKNHKLVEWRQFCDYINNNLKCKHYIGVKNEDKTGICK